MLCRTRSRRAIFAPLVAPTRRTIAPPRKQALNVPQLLTASKMPPLLFLQRWLLGVACLRMLSVIIGYTNPAQFKTKLFDRAPNQVTDLYGRTFAIWTLVTCSLCVICSQDPTNRAIYGATLLSFLAALLHFTTELFIYKTMSIKGAMSPFIVASVSAVWMTAGFNYYTGGCQGECKAQ